jgi:hypothetical protein
MPKTEYTARGYTEQIGRKAAENICHAFDYAKYINRALNTYIVINLTALPDDACRTQAFARIRHKFRDWMSRKHMTTDGATEPPRYVYSMEAPNGDDHANWVVHIPERFLAEFEKKLPKWVARILGDERPFDIDIQKVTREADKSLAKYVIKGADPAYIDYLHLGTVAAPQGRVWGRRCGASPAIGRTARKKAGFVARRDRNKWRKNA